MGVLVVVLLIYFFVNFIIAIIMSATTQFKGYTSEAHAFGYTLVFGLFGCIYTAALPDKVVQKQNEEIIKLLKN